jgi:hypothetical protein
LGEGGCAAREGEQKGGGKGKAVHRYETHGRMFRILAELGRRSVREDSGQNFATGGVPWQSKG